MSCDVVRVPDARAPARVGDGDRLGPGRERAVGRDARVVGRADHGADRLGPEFRAGLGGRPAVGGRRRRGSRSGPGGRPSRRAPRRPGRSRRRSRPAGGGPPRRSDPTTRPRPACRSTTRRLIEMLVSATFWWISLLAKRVSAESSAGDEGLGLGHALAQRIGQCRLGEAQRVLGAVVVHRLPPAPTTCRPRPGRRGNARPARRARRGRSGRARPCRSSASRASRSSTRRRRRRTTARTRR